MTEDEEFEQHYADLVDNLNLFSEIVIVVSSLQANGVVLHDCAYAARDNGRATTVSADVLERMLNDPRVRQSAVPIRVIQSNMDEPPSDLR